MFLTAHRLPVCADDSDRTNAEPSDNCVRGCVSSNKVMSLFPADEANG